MLVNKAIESGFTHIGTILGAKFYCRSDENGETVIEPVSSLGRKVEQGLKAVNIKPRLSKVRPIYLYYAIRFEAPGLSLMNLPEIKAPHQIASVHMMANSSSRARLMVVAFSNLDPKNDEMAMLWGLLDSTGVGYETRALSGDLDKAWYRRMLDVDGAMQGCSKQWSNWNPQV